MGRRDFVTLLGGAAATWPLTGHAQVRLPRVGALLYGPTLLAEELPIAGELARLGYVNGRNVSYVSRGIEGDVSSLPHHARELVAAKPHVIVSLTSSAAVALFNATHEIPSVMTNVGDPVALGLTTSISHPTRNVTSFTISSLSLAAKRLEILHEVSPSFHKAAYLWAPDNPVADSFK